MVRFQISAIQDFTLGRGVIWIKNLSLSKIEKKIDGKTPDEVKAILGKPDSFRKTLLFSYFDYFGKVYNEYTEKKENISVFFNEGKAICLLTL